MEEPANPRDDDTLQGQVIRIHFWLHETELFSFRFE